MLELVDYDLVGSSRLNLTFRRRAVFESDPSLPVPLREDGSPAVAVDAKGVATRMVSPPGPLVTTSLERAEIDREAWERLLSSFDSFTAAALGVAESYYAATQTDAAALDAKISAAEVARLDKAQLDEEILVAKQVKATLVAEAEALRAVQAAPTEPALVDVVAEPEPSALPPHRRLGAAAVRAAAVAKRKRS